MTSAQAKQRQGRTYYGAGEIPPYVQYTSPVSQHGRNGDEGLSSVTLPLNLVARIVSYLDDIGDIARVTRASRLLYYMTVPQLYQRVSLHSYAGIRYANGKPEGYGSGSPFIMGLNGLVTRGHAALVQEFKVFGEWQEVGVEEFAKGRVPDNSMMLNILLRAAVDKMVKMHSFTWELDCKPLKTLYLGLSTNHTLTNLSINFPSSRVPRPSVLLMPIPNLRVFKASGIDPLCYPDDFDLLLLGSKKLEDVRLHFSPRMRREADPTLNLETYFGRCDKAGYKLKLKHFAMQNFIGSIGTGLHNIFAGGKCGSVTFIDVFGGIDGDPRNVYIDAAWKDIPMELGTEYKYTRVNELSQQHVQILNDTSGLERFYFVGPREGRTPQIGRSPEEIMTPGTTPPAHQELPAIARDYLHALTRKHGATLKHLLLPPQWGLNPEDVADLVRYCPNLEQLGLALNFDNHTIMRLLMPFLTKLRTLRILKNDWLLEQLRIVSHEFRMSAMSVALVKVPLEYIALGDAVYKIGATYEMRKEDGSAVEKRHLSFAQPEDLREVELWSLDVPSIDADPVAPP